MTGKNYPPDIHENLVAYLDGELTERQTRAVEKALSTDPSLRQRLAELKQTWQMLDTLPHPQATGAFTQQTMETVQFTPGSPPPVKSNWRRRRHLLVPRAGIVLGLTVSAALGYLITNRWSNDDTTMLLRDYSVIQQLDGLSDIGSTEFLRELDESGLFDGSQ